MLKQAIVALYLVVSVVLTAPLAAQAYTSGVEHVGEDTASFLASPFAAAFDPAPQMARPPVYSTPVHTPPGQCRWERQILDRYGRPVLDQRGQPLREYTIGPCWRPPY